MKVIKYTHIIPLKTNMAMKNPPFEDVSPIQNVDFLAGHASFPTVVLLCITPYSNSATNKREALLAIESWLFNDGIIISWFMKQSPYNWLGNMSSPYMISHNQ